MVKSNVRKSNRSGENECPVCGCAAPLVEHHIHGREVRGWRGDWNIAAICASCHDLVHIGEVMIIGWFGTTDGRELIWYEKEEGPPGGFPDAAVPPLYR